MTRQRRGIRRPALAVLVVLAMAGTGLGAWLLGRSDSSQQASRALTASGVAGHVRRPVHHRPLGPGARELQAAIQRDLGPAGPNTGAYVYDLGADQQVVDVRGGFGRAPASVEKLYTSTALLRSMGIGARLQTTVVGKGSLAGGIWHGDLYLRGGGDPTLGTEAFNRRWLGTDAATVNELVRQIQARGIKRVTGAVIGDGSMFDGARGGPDTHYAPDVGDLGGQLSGLTINHGAAGKVGWDPAGFAAQQLGVALNQARIPTGPAGAVGRAPRRSRKLASVASPNVGAMLRLMNVPSDDFFAEMLTKQLGARFAHNGSTPAGVHVISGDISAFGIHPKLVDGSGLSHDNNSSPRDVVKLLRGMWRTREGDALAASLPLVGVNGTTRRIAARTRAAGQCVAKTGTLNGVTNLAGYCHSGGRQMLAFAVFLDGPSNYAGIQVLGRVVEDMVYANVARH